MIWLVACTSEEDSSPVDTAPTAPTCDPVTVELTQEYVQADLPAGGSLEHTEPGIAVGDLDSDGDLDALTSYAGGAFVLRNDGTGALDVDATAFGTYGPLSIAVALADIDLDGDLDGWLAEWPHGEVLAWNDGAGRFTVERLADGVEGITSWTGAWGDADGDDDLDLFVATRVPDIIPPDILEGTQEGTPNHFYVNEGGVLVRDDARIPAEGNRGLTFHTAWLDVEGDGDLDLYEGNDWGYFLDPNRLLRNDGNGYFTQDPEFDYPMYAMGVAVGDVNGDRLPDVYVTDIASPDLLVSTGGRLADATLSLHADIPASDTNVTSWGTSFADFDRNGCSDLVVAFGRLGSDMDTYLEGLPGVEGATTDPELQSNVMLVNTCDGFERLTGSAFDENLARDRSVAVADLDADGRPDVISGGRQFIRRWMVGGGCANGATVRLDQGGANPFAIGARVTHEADGRSSTQWMLPSTAHSQNAPELYLGLGAATDATVTVVWPGGEETTAEVAAGDVVTLSP